MTDTVHILRGKMKFRMVTDEDMASICMCDDCSSLDAFIDIYINDESIPSPFRTVDDAILFAEIIVKLLEVVT